MADTSTCFDLRCGFVAPGRVETCPKCGRKMRSSRTVRVYGVVLMLCGLVVLGLMGPITYYTLPELTHPGQELVEGTRFTGSGDEADMILWLFGLLLLFGLVATLTGLWQVATGRRNRWISIGAVALGLLIFAYAQWTTGQLG